VPRTEDRDPLIQLAVSPRFEVFYALQALASGAGEHLGGWRRGMERELPARLRTSLAGIAPSPLIWPLLADALRDAPSGVTFAEMMVILRDLEERTFQRFVLGGVFKSPGAVDDLIEGNATLSRTVATEARVQEKLLHVLGLYPYARNDPSIAVFERIVKEPGKYRDEVADVLQAFWTVGFSDTWNRLEAELKECCTRELKRVASPALFAPFARERKLPVTIEGDEVRSSASGKRLSSKSSSAIYLMPSVFNTARLWAAYADARGRTRFFIPILFPDISPDPRAVADPALVFKALGDTTRYAIASAIARKPMTSVELARAFGVSKPTISHHVRVLREADLLDESPSDRGLLLTLERRVLERASAAAAREMFSVDGPEPVIKRSRKANKNRST